MIINLYDLLFQHLFGHKYLTGDQKMKKISIIIGTRPEAIKMVPVYQSLKNRFGSNNVDLISTGQHQELLWKRS
jgi:hypothetical protein